MTNIEYQGSFLINFRSFEFPKWGNPSWQWLSLKEFRIHDPDASDQQILLAIMGAEEFRDDYIGASIDPTSDHHGPYWLDHITPVSYTLTSADSTKEILTKWMSNCGIIPSSLRLEIDKKIFQPIRSASSLYVLNDLDQFAINEFGFIHTEFHEVISIDRDKQSVKLIVAADD